jgi:FMN phosphatase YigB (HAD superfamily)
MIRAVVFDVGETLVDETRSWAAWADFMGVPHFTFFAAMGIVVERGLHHHAVFELVRPGFDRAAAVAEREAAGWRYGFEIGDFYPDAIPCLTALRAAGFRVGLAGNQPEAAEAALAAIGAPADFIASSAGWGVEKPSPEFFARVAEAAGAKPQEIAYVGDRLDNDVLPAAACGMAAVFLRRGPWGLAHDGDPRLSTAVIRITDLAALPELIRRL